MASNKQGTHHEGPVHRAEGIRKGSRVEGGSLLHTEMGTIGVSAS